MKFCGDCGATLGAAPQAAPSPAAPREASTAERRLVSVLFADLVGFTPLSESRDAEEVRELLSRYFEQARTVIERHGGTVEKFIGDAVMAVWGAPVAREDDAQRAVRAALDLVGVVTALGHEVGAPGLRARAGVLTGEAAVMPEGTGEGLVAGGLVNTASRIQSVAEPGTVSVTGIAGIGKSRLSWEFEKYVDGLAQEAFWHRGRCLSYGEGVAYWALAEMVRMRCGIVEDEEPQAALAKLHAAVDEHIPDPEERLWVVPRLAHLLGVEEGVPGDQENLFSAWRILFERLAEQSPTILVFEDMQWADAGLLDFLEYLLEWSRSHPLFVLVLARPELADKRPTWGAGKRSFTSLHLEPLSPQAMDDLLSGLVPGLPEELRQRILDRAEGVPLYAVETVRMLLDRGLLAQEGNVYKPTGAVETLEVPETLHSLIAARLDSLTPEERRLVQDGSVLGKTFTKDGLTALTGTAADELEPLLSGLLRKEILSIQADPRSPERGQYSFLQDIVKRVAYETISKRERKAKHLAAAQFLSSAWSAEEDEIVEVVAAHYLDAYRVAPDDPGAEEIRAKALEMLVRAAERAASLAATVEAQHAFERALELTDDALVQAELSERAGMVAQVGARAEEASAHFERSIECFEAGGARHAAARVSARLAEIMWDRGRIEQGLESMNRSFEVLSQEEPDADLAALAAQLGRFMFFAGQTDLAMQRIEIALDLAEGLWLPETLSQALNTRAIVLNARGRPREALALLRYALDVAVEHDKPSAALRAYYNLGETLAQGDRYEIAAETYRSGLTLARRVGNRYWERAFLGTAFAHFCSGAWSDVMEMWAGLLEEEWSQTRLAFSGILTPFVLVSVHRGQLDRAEQFVSGLAELEQSADVQERAAYAASRSVLLLGKGDAPEALRLAQLAFETRDVNGAAHEVIKVSFVTAVEAAAELGDRAKAEELLAVVEALPSGRCPQFLSAHLSRFHGKLAAQEGGSERIDDLFKGATGLFRELATPFYLAVTQLEYGEWLATQGRAEEAEPLLAEAREVFEGLEARPWLERAGRAAGVEREAEAVHTKS